MKPSGSGRSRSTGGWTPTSRFEDGQWNTFRYPDPDDIDHPSGLFEQLLWLQQAGLVAVDVHWMRAGQAIFSAWKPDPPG